jgi:hypothetical protein
MKNVKHSTTKAQRPASVGHLGDVNSGGVNGGVFSLSGSHTPRRNGPKRHGTAKVPGRTHEGGDGLQGRNNGAIQGSPGVPGGNIPTGSGATTQNQTIEMKQYILDLPAALFVGLVFFLCLTTRFPQERFEPCAPQQATITGPSVEDVRRAIDSGRQELVNEAYKFNQELKKVKLANPYDGKAE